MTWVFFSYHKSCSVRDLSTAISNSMIDVVLEISSIFQRYSLLVNFKIILVIFGAKLVEFSFFKIYIEKNFNYRSAVLLQFCIDLQT